MRRIRYLMTVQGTGKRREQEATFRETDAARGQAQEIFKAGFNCAEAVFLVVTRAFGLDVPEQVRLVTAFGGGVGRCREEMWGPWQGACWPWGHCADANSPEPAGPCGAAGSTVCEDALAAHGSIRCDDLLHVFGEQTDMQACIRFTAMVAGLVVARLRQARDDGELALSAIPPRTTGDAVA